MALKNSVNKLPLAASASKARLIVVTWYFMFAFGLLYVRFQEWPKKGPLFESDSNKRWGAKIGPLFELDSNKRWGLKWGHYSSHLLGHY